MATKIGQFAQELTKTNPWWRDDAGWQATDPDLRAAQHRGLGYTPHVLDDLASGGLYLLRGPRRVGKTVTVKQKIGLLIAAGVPARSIVRVAADGMAAKQIRTIVSATSLPATEQPRWWFFDEITDASSGWERQIKWLRDNDQGFAADTVVLTGSNAAELTSAAGVLAGRRGGTANSDRTLLPMGFATFVRLLRDDLPETPAVGVAELRSRAAREAYEELLPWLDVLVTLWERYLGYGGFPVAVAAAHDGDPVPEGFCDDLFNVITRDTFGTSRLSVTESTSLLERLWASIASPANLSAIGKHVGVSHDVVVRHVGYLRDAYLLWHCPQKADRGWRPRQRAQDKLYAIDPLIARLPHLRNPNRRDIDPTVLAEMQLGLALHRSAYAAGRPWADDQFVFYVRTPTRKEIDFVAEPLADVAIEAKYTEGGNWAGDARTVNSSPWDGILATRNVYDCTGEDAWAVPAGMLAFLIDT